MSCQMEAQNSVRAHAFMCQVPITALFKRMQALDELEVRRTHVHAKSQHARASARTHARAHMQVRNLDDEETLSDYDNAG